MKLKQVKQVHKGYEGKEKNRCIHKGYEGKEKQVHKGYEAKTGT